MSTITVTDIHTGDSKTISAYEFKETVQPWFPDSTPEIDGEIDRVQAELSAGTFIHDSAFDSLGLRIDGTGR